MTQKTKTEYKFNYPKRERVRLDRFLVNRDKEELYSRNFVEQLIENGFVKVNKTVMKKSHKLKYGDTVTVTIPEQKDPELKPENIPLDIIYEDEYFAVINKQARICVHPTPNRFTGTIANALLYHFGDNLSKLDTVRPGIVHRLDKDTSGVLIIPKNDLVHSKFGEIFKERRIDKFYKAIVLGEPKITGTIDTYIDRRRQDKIKMSATERRGKHAITHYEIEESFVYFSLLNLKIETGRTHQIRVHLKSINHPILGDNLYNSKIRTLNRIPSHLRGKVKILLDKLMRRQALHAYKIVFKHPITNEMLAVKADYPTDIRDTLNWLKKNFRIS